MGYKAICDEFGNKGLLTGATVPLAAAYVAHKTGVQPDYTLAVLLSTSGMMGICLGIAVEPLAKLTARGFRMGMTRGSKLVQRTQATVYALPIAFSLAVQAVPPVSKHHDDQAWKDHLQTMETFKNHRAIVTP